MTLKGIHYRGYHCMSMCLLFCILQGSSVLPCNIATEFLLSPPNDGVVEKDRAQLPYGKAVNHKVGQCHSEGMNYPPQCHDATRNSEMNKNAAR